MGTAAVVLGASGYSGGEVLRLLTRHPAIDVVGAAAGARGGEPIGDVHPNLAGLYDDPFVSMKDALSRAPDVVFSCLPHGELAAAGVPDASLVIDLSGDHRADGGWVYGLTEFARSSVAGGVRIANPGC